ncbi:unnamed protein product [Hermetia illucens]|nr:unnamed protein product [Hermetia illucens]
MLITKFNPLVYFRSSAMEFSDVRHVVVFSIADQALHHPSGVVESSCLSLRQVKYYNGGPDFNFNGMHLVMYNAYNYVNCKEDFDIILSIIVLFLMIEDSFLLSSAMEFSDVRHVVVFSIADQALHHPSGVVESSCLSLRQLYLIQNGKRVKKKKTSNGKSNDPTNPIWNEAFNFSVPTSAVNSTGIEIYVVSTGGEANAIGSCGLGLQEHGPGKQHWQDMIHNARKPTAMWHYLR